METFLKCLPKGARDPEWNPAFFLLPGTTAVCTHSRREHRQRLALSQTAAWINPPLRFLCRMDGQVPAEHGGPQAWLLEDPSAPLELNVTDKQLGSSSNFLVGVPFVLVIA